MVFGQLNTTKTWTELLGDLREEFRKWGIQDYVLPVHALCKAQGSVNVEFVLRGEWVTPQCSRWGPGEYKWLERNLCAIVVAIRAARMADQRGIGDIFAQVAQHLALPDKDDPYAVLGLEGRAAVSDAELKAAYRVASKRAHPDQGGSAEEFLRVKEAYDTIMKAGDP